MARAKSLFNSLRSKRAEQTFYESGRSRRADHRGTFQTRLSTHTQLDSSCFFQGFSIDDRREPAPNGF